MEFVSELSIEKPLLEVVNDQLYRSYLIINVFEQDDGNFYGVSTDGLYEGESPNLNQLRDLIEEKVWGRLFLNRQEFRQIYMTGNTSSLTK